MRIAEEMADQQLQEANAYNLEIAAHHHPEPSAPPPVRTAAAEPEKPPATLFGVCGRWLSTGLSAVCPGGYQPQSSRVCQVLRQVA